MRGKWIKKMPKDPKLHECKPPRIRRNRGTGSVWKCNCGIQWEIVSAGPGRFSYLDRLR